MKNPSRLVEFENPPPLLLAGEREARGGLRGGADEDAGPDLEQVGARAGEVRAHLPNVLRGTRNVT